MADDPTARFAALVARKDQPVPLDEALLLIAAHVQRDLDVDAQRTRLDELAAGVPDCSVTALRAPRSLASVSSPPCLVACWSLTAQKCLIASLSRAFSLSVPSVMGTSTMHAHGGRVE